MKIYAISGGAFGDEGKGATVDYLAITHKADMVVRVGGPQAAHTVVHSDGISHTFSQFGSATLSGIPTHLSSGMLVAPKALLNEATVLRGKGVADPLRLLTISPEAIIISPCHKQECRRKEDERGRQRHGSTGMGVWEALSDPGAPITFRDVMGGEEIDILQRQIDRYSSDLSPRDISDFLSACAELRKHVSMRSDDSAAHKRATVIVENSQGALLHPDRGCLPYVTATDPTFEPAQRFAALCNEKIERVLVLRSYFTRHGAGPLPTENAALNHPEPHNFTHPYMGNFRQGDFDVTLAKLGMEICGPFDTLAINHGDRWKEGSSVRPGNWWKGREWEPCTYREKVNRLGDLIRNRDLLGLDCPVIFGSGPTAADRTMVEW